MIVIKKKDTMPPAMSTEVDLLGKGSRKDSVTAARIPMTRNERQRSNTAKTIEILYLYVESGDGKF